VNPGPAPTLVTDWFTWAFVLGVAWLVFLAWLTLYILNAREDRREDDPYAQDVADYHCRGNSHHYEAIGYDWVCAHCGDVVRQPLGCAGRHHYVTRGQSLTCTVCGFRTELPYDQDLDGTDLGQWDREVGA